MPCDRERRPRRRLAVPRDDLEPERSAHRRLAYNDLPIFPVKRLRVGVLYGGRSGEHEVSLASAAAVFANLDRQRYEPVAIRIEKDGRWVLADRPPSAASAAEVIEQTRSEARACAAAAKCSCRHVRAMTTIVLVDADRSATTKPKPRPRSQDSGLDVVFPVLHGPVRRGRHDPGSARTGQRAYVGCGVLASAVGMDKAVMKVLFRARGLRVRIGSVVGAGTGGRSPRAVAAAIDKALAYPLFVKPANMGSSVGISKVHEPAELGGRAR